MKLFFLFLLFPISLAAQSRLGNIVKPTDFKVLGEVSKIKINENDSLEYLKDYDSIVVFLRIKLKNTGNTPILLLSNRVSFIEVNIAQSIDEFETTTGEFSVYHLQTSASFIDDKMWKANKKILDTKKPDLKKIFFLLPNEYIEYEDNIRINLPKNEIDRYKFSPWKKHSLEQLKQLSTILIRLKNYGLIDNYGVSKKDKKRFTFAKELQKRWKKYGYLWLDDITSEPIPLDLSFLNVNHSISE